MFPATPFSLPLLQRLLEMAGLTKLTNPNTMSDVTLLPPSSCPGRRYSCRSRTSFYIVLGIKVFIEGFGEFDSPKVFDTRVNFKIYGIESFPRAKVSLSVSAPGTRLFTISQKSKGSEWLRTQYTGENLPKRESSNGITLGIGTCWLLLLAWLSNLADMSDSLLESWYIFYRRGIRKDLGRSEIWEWMPCGQEALNSVNFRKEKERGMDSETCYYHLIDSSYQSKRHRFRNHGTVLEKKTFLSIRRSRTSA